MIGLEHMLRTGLSAPFSSMQDFLQAGGWVLRWILLLALFLWAMVLERYWFLWRIYPAEKSLRYDRWRARADHCSWYAQRIREGLVSELKVGMNAPLPLIRLVVPLSPLLGLLGTVTGMLEVFDALQQRGNTDVRAMAAGVSHAMVSTLAGLVVSLVGLFFYTQLRGRVQRETARLQRLFPPV